MNRLQALRLRYFLVCLIAVLLTAALALSLYWIRKKVVQEMGSQGSFCNRPTIVFKNQRRELVNNEYVKVDYVLQGQFMFFTCVPANNGQISWFIEPHAPNRIEDGDFVVHTQFSRGMLKIGCMEISGQCRMVTEKFIDVKLSK